MDDWDVEHTVSRQRQQDLLREAENRRLVRALRESRKASHEDRRGRKVWEDRETVEALAGSPSYQRAVRELAESGLLVRVQSVEIFEVAGGALRLEALAGALGSGDD